MSIWDICGELAMHLLAVKKLARGSSRLSNCITKGDGLESSRTAALKITRGLPRRTFQGHIVLEKEKRNRKKECMRVSAYNKRSIATSHDDDAKRPIKNWTKGSHGPAGDSSPG